MVGAKCSGIRIDLASNYVQRGFTAAFAVCVWGRIAISCGAPACRVSPHLTHQHAQGGSTCCPWEGLHACPPEGPPAPQ